MTKLITLLFFLILGLNGFAQNTFLQGYYINNSNERMDCLIKNGDWLNNPTQFEYKLSENSEQKIQTITSVKEFEITGITKYVRQDVDIDRSSAIIEEMDYNKNPVFNREQLFLKVLIEGKGNLYLYEDNGLIRYFFNQDLTEVKQLVFKNYLTDNGQVAKNQHFRQQLWNALKCESISMDQVAKISYRQSELIKFFIKYNECTNSEFVNYKTKQKKDLFNLTIRPGVTISSLVLDGPIREPFDFDEGLTSFRFGLEAEFILGFNNNKWAMILEPTYQQFESEAVVISNRTTGEKSIAKINNESIQVNLGIRYYMFLNKDLKLFTNVSMVIDNNNSSVDVRSERGLPIFSSEGMSGISAALGIGCKYKERYNLELRYIPNRNILNGQGAWGTKFSSVSMVLGYSMF
ncbi:tRNA modification GTPase [Hyunsoonleella sp. SJ7]|uniref:tRNA modification GTPase n=1 Tax=Hyunsoonleella aquatilis TaxID=2762758 RepID=A0A923KLX2_9FLAO|nr:tRNA modification GTPase [Hyunsoonleella aquatilis]MBC3759233.1 tRNA modification GTPase [Hyunsoonleella aquatilis]